MPIKISKARVAVLTNCLSHLNSPALRCLAREVGALRVLVNAPTDSNRPWKSPQDWDELDVVLQRAMTLRSTQRHPLGFSSEGQLHVPYDTVPQLQKFAPDVVISSEMGARTLQALLYTALHRRCKLIIGAALSDHTEQGRSILRRRLRTLIVPRADALLVNGEGGRRYLRQFGVSDERMFTAPYMTDLGLFWGATSRSNAEAHRLLYVGQLIERKGLLPFLRVLCRWAQRNSSREIYFSIVGGGPQKRDILSFTAPPNLKIQLYDAAQNTELPPFFRQSGIFVLPTLADEWGVVVNEAMAASLPVLGSVYSQAVEELIQEGVHGWRFRPADPETIDRAIDRALSTPPDQLNEMRTKAQAAIRRYTPTFLATQIVEAIRYVTQNEPDLNRSGATRNCDTEHSTV